MSDKNGAGDEKEEVDGDQRPPRHPPLQPTADDPQASVTSRETGSDLDLVRHAIQALQLYAERGHDDQELQLVHKCIVGLEGILASHAKDRDAALGISPSLRHVCRVSRGSGY